MRVTRAQRNVFVFATLAALAAPASAQNGLTSRGNSPAEFAAFTREEIPKWAKVVKDSGAKAD
jgi:tripartite-type tricarboxylate transporter receptor subunit TctC